MRLFVLAVVFVVGCESHDLGGLSVEEQAVLGCWQGGEGSTVVQYWFHPDHSSGRKPLPNGQFSGGTYRVEGTDLYLDFGDEVMHPVFVSTRTITYADTAAVLTRVVCP